VAPGLSHRRPANYAGFLAFPCGIPYATGLRHLVSRRRDAMEKKSGNRKGTAKDLPPRKTQDVKGGVNATRFDPYRNFKFRVAG